MSSSWPSPYPCAPRSHTQPHCPRTYYPYLKSRYLALPSHGYHDRRLLIVQVPFEHELRQELNVGRVLAPIGVLVVEEYVVRERGCVEFGQAWEVDRGGFAEMHVREGWALAFSRFLDDR